MRTTGLTIILSVALSSIVFSKSDYLKENLDRLIGMWLKILYNKYDCGRDHASIPNYVAICGL